MEEAAAATRWGEGRAARYALVLLSIALYPIAFVTMYGPLGPGVLAFYVVPIAIAAFFLGLWPTIGVTLLYPVVSTLALNAAGEPGWDALVRMGGATGILGYLIFGAIVGWTSDLRRRVHAQAAELVREREALRVEAAERRRAEEAAAEERALQSLTMQAQSDLDLGLVVMRGEEVLHVNDAFARLTGRDRANLDRLPSLVELTAPAERARVRDLLERLVRGEEVAQSLETRIVDASGRTRDVEVALKAFRQEGAPLTVSVVRDVTERKLVEATLRRSNELLEEAQRTAQLGSWSYDVASGEVTWSDEMCRIFGFGPGMASLDFEGYLSRVHPDDRAGVQRAVEGAMATGESYVVEHRVVRPDGSVRVVEGRGRVELGADGKAARLFGTGMDVTEKRLAEAELAAARERELELESLREVNQLKTQFVNMAAHELGTPLTPIRLQLHVLRTTHGAGLTPPQRRSLDILERNIERLATLVKDVLDGARLQAGRLVIVKAPMDLRDVVRETAESFDEPARAGGVELVVRADEHLPMEADARRLAQVLYNLLGNAIKFTPEGGRVLIEARREGDDALVRVADTGVGVAAEDLPKLFQPFSQVHAHQSAHGTGLGLYISRGIVEEHGGRIWCESGGEGSGSTFAFTVPAKPPRDLFSE